MTARAERHRGGLEGAGHTDGPGTAGSAPERHTDGLRHPPVEYPEEAIPGEWVKLASSPLLLVAQGCEVLNLALDSDITERGSLVALARGWLRAAEIPAVFRPRKDRHHEVRPGNQDRYPRHRGSCHRGHAVGLRGTSCRAAGCIAPAAPTLAPPAASPVSTAATLTGTCTTDPAAGQYLVTLTNKGSVAADVTGFSVAFFTGSGSSPSETGSADAGPFDTFLLPGQSLTWTEDTTMMQSGQTGAYDTSATCTLVRWYHP